MNSWYVFTIYNKQGYSKQRERDPRPEIFNDHSFYSHFLLTVHTGADPSESKWKNSGFLANMLPNFPIKINRDEF